jgi:hypothetical protein
MGEATAAGGGADDGVERLIAWKFAPTHDVTPAKAGAHPEVVRLREGA